MATERIGMLVARVRKKLGSSTVDVYTLNRVYVMAITEIVKIYGYEEAIRRLFEWGYVMGHAYVMRLRKDIERASVSAQTIKFLGRLAWYLFAGTDPEVEMTIREVDEGPMYVLTIRDDKSPWDMGVKMGKKIAYYPAGAYEGAGNTHSILAGGGKWRVYTRLTKSMSAGDPYTELVHIYAPANRPPEKIVEDFPGLFEEIPIEFSEELYRRTFK